ncbi:hypothetical protein IFM89_024912 [Coptis chinensis]|uniref:Uncharacterized protein n=1 Tax=Coptis chinensis TaxID=261450 RepID=A0A835MJ55_9MAGN|nr:hypothetical protein IFM89_024912 [Coptis chinensis]
MAIWLSSIPSKPNGARFSTAYAGTLLLQSLSCGPDHPGRGRNFHKCSYDVQGHRKDAYSSSLFARSLKKNGAFLSEKNELRDEKQRLKAEKEKLEHQVKAMTSQPSFMPHPSAIPTAFAPQAQALATKPMPFIVYLEFPCGKSCHLQ